jgi:O-antigen ligase
MNTEKISTIYYSFLRMPVVERIALALVVCTPLFYMAVPHWITNISILAAVFSIFAIWGHDGFSSVMRSNEVKSVLLIFLIYTIAILVSQVGRLSFSTSAYLDQTRWIIGVPIFLFLLFKQINYTEVLDWTLPICVLTAWISSVFVIPSNAWGDRATVSFMDPLAFGSTNLAVGLMCLASALVDLANKKWSINTFVKLLAFFIGIYLSIRTGSRTGWIGLPVGLFLILGFIFKRNIKYYLITIGLMLIAVVFVYYFSAKVYIRVDQALSEIIDYPWFGGVAPDTSVGLRITFYRLGAFYFSNSPLFGWGERGYGVIKDAPQLLLFSTQFARDFAFGALFHSEWTTQAVRYGMLGIFGVFWIFWVPISLFYKFQKRHAELLKVSCIGMIFMVCQLAASFSNEVFDSKAMISFTATIVAGLLATGLSFNNKRL